MRSIGRVAAVVGAMALALTACSTSSGGTAASGGSAPASGDAAASGEAPQSAVTDLSGDVPKGDGSKTIYLVSKGFQHRFWQAVKEGAEQAGAEYGYKIQFVGPADEQQVTEQMNQLTTALGTNPAAIGFAALDSGAAESILKQVDAKGIPVIAFDSGVDSDIPVTTVSTDNYAAAQEAAKHMVELTGGKGTIALVCHDQTSATGKDRCKGFQDYMKENAPDMKVLDPQYAGEVGKAADTTKSILQANSDVVGVYGSNEASATGAIQGANELGKSEVKVVGFDSGKTQIAAIKDGSQAGAITQSPVKMGYLTVKAAIMAINGQELPDRVDSGFAWYDKTNIDSEDIKANLYE
ncbi:MAG: ABC transporter substrate-binding protein [Actinomycetaceae bacterium]|nr:ABC transporter substrate-binding protein [Actinomycetaceae bacterium]